MINDFSYRAFDFSFDIYPKVIKVENEVILTITQKDNKFEGEYNVQIVPMNEGVHWAYPCRKNETYLKATAEKGELKLKYTFPDESEYLISISKDGKFIKELPVYAVNNDLWGRYPYVGDLHVHSTCSDGRQSVKQVVRNYRKNGYDFFALTDHGKYYPSTEAVEFAKKCGTDMAVFPGEEVHLNVTDIHIVNFGGKSSVNALLKTSPQCNETKTVPEDSRTGEELMDEVMKIAQTIDVPEGVEAKDVAACKWIFDRIREKEGIAIYAHPFWRKPEYHVPVTLNDCILERRDFDAFEVLGGERYFDQNGLQVIKYYEFKEKGIDFPVVGSSDSHNVTDENRGALIARTVVLSRSLEYEDLKNAILSKEHYSIPIDCRPHDFGIVAPFRLATYVSFLLRCFFPIHDKLCSDEGDVIDECVKGNEDAFAEMNAFKGKTKELYKKYFAF